MWCYKITICRWRLPASRFKPGSDSGTHLTHFCGSTSLFVSIQVALALVEVYSPALLATADEIDAFQVGEGFQLDSCLLPVFFL